MRGAEHEIYCTVAEAGCVLGISPNEVRVKMNRGELNLGTVEKRNRYSVYRIRKDLVIKEAGLSEFPEDASASPKKRKAEYTALMLKKEGIDVQKVADIFLESKIITPYTGRYYTTASRKELERAGKHLLHGFSFFS